MGFITAPTITAGLWRLLFLAGPQNSFIHFAETIQKQSLVDETVP
jgi:hypothetical protein